MDTTSYRLPEELIGDVARLAEARGISKSEVVREALVEYVSRRTVELRKLDRVAALDAVLARVPDEAKGAARAAKAGLGESSLAPEQRRARRKSSRANQR